MSVTAPQPTKSERTSWLREDRLAYLVIFLTLFVGAGAYGIFARIDYLSANSPYSGAIFIASFCALILLLIFVGRQIWRIWRERRQRMAGSQLHWRLALLLGASQRSPLLLWPFLLLLS